MRWGYLVGTPGPGSPVGPGNFGLSPEAASPCARATGDLEPAEVRSGVGATTERFATLKQLHVVQASGHATVARGVEPVHIDRDTAVIAGLDRFHERLQILIHAARAVARAGGEDPRAGTLGTERIAAWPRAVAVMDDGLDRLVEGVGLARKLLLGSLGFGFAQRLHGGGIRLRDDDGDGELVLVAIVLLRFGEERIRETDLTGDDFGA